MRAGLVFVVALSACGEDAASPTYWRDVAPIVQTSCVGCHREGGVGPFALGTYAQAFARKATIRRMVTERLMPPWPPGPGCNQYEHDRSLSQDDIDTIDAWVDGGAKEGSKKDAPEPVEPTGTGLPRVDQLLTMPETYSPVLSPDDYRCFLLDWPETTTKYITGQHVLPGSEAVVHHVILFIAPPEAASSFVAMDDGEPGPGYTCFGGSGGDAAMMGGWAPGALGRVLPAGTGLRIEPGSKVIMQVHYNTHEHDPATVHDQTAVELMLDDAVDRPAYVMQWTNPFWLDGNMTIDAGDPAATHAFSFDPTPYFSQVESMGVDLPDNSPFLIYSANLHMHLRGRSANLTVRRDGEDTCLLDIPAWDFHWQGDYMLKAPVRFEPGDRLRIECVWDNSAENQPEINGETLPVETLNWGDGTTEEMCIGFLLVSAP